MVRIVAGGLQATASPHEMCNKFQTLIISLAVKVNLSLLRLQKDLIKNNLLMILKACSNNEKQKQQAGKI